MAHPLEGVMALPSTPLNNDYSLNEDAIRRQVDWYIDQGAAGLWVDGFFAECNQIDEMVRRRAHEVFIEAARGRVFMGAGCYGINPFQSIRLANHAADLGYDMAWMPTPWKVPEEEIFQFFKIIHDNTRIRLGIYNTDGLGVYLRPALVARIAELERMLCMKDTTQDFAHICGLANLGVFKRLKVFPTRAFVIYMKLGAAGLLAAPARFKQTREIYNMFKNGDEDGAFKKEVASEGAAQAVFVRLSSWAWGAPRTRSTNGWSKAVSGMSMGVDLGPPMAPGLPLSDAERKLMEDMKSTGKPIGFFPPA